MAYISFQPSDFYNTTLYTGTGAEHAVTGVGFSADFTWNKNRNNAENHNLWDTVRTAGEGLRSDTNGVEFTTAQGLKSWQSDGFTMGTNGSVNGSAATFASYNWKGGTTTGIDTTGSTITPSAYSFSATAGISIVKYYGDGVSGRKIPHGLGVAPEIVIVKILNGTGSWDIVSKYTGATYYFRLDTTGAKATGTWAFNDTLPDSVNFTVGDNAETNSSNGNIAYSFASIKGFSKIGSYTGNSDSNGPFIFTGFRPAYVMIKNVDESQAWNTWNNKMSTSGKNVADKNLQPNATTAEQTSVSGVKEIDLVSNGFKIRGNNTEINNSGQTHVYTAFAEFPFVSSNSKAGTAR